MSSVFTCFKLGSLLFGLNLRGPTLKVAQVVCTTCLQKKTEMIAKPMGEALQSITQAVLKCKNHGCGDNVLLYSCVWVVSSIRSKKFRPKSTSIQMKFVF